MEKNSKFLKMVKTLNLIISVIMYFLDVIFGGIIAIIFFSVVNSIFVENKKIKVDNEIFVFQIVTAAYLFRVFIYEKILIGVILLMYFVYLFFKNKNKVLKNYLCIILGCMIVEFIGYEFNFVFRLAVSFLYFLMVYYFIDVIILFFVFQTKLGKIMKDKKTGYWFWFFLCYYSVGVFCSNAVIFKEREKMKDLKVEINEKSKYWNSEKYEKNARFVSDYGVDVISWLAPKPDEYILDLGCGDGVLTKKIMETGCKVIGVDGSLDFVIAARKIGVNAIQMDGQNLSFEKEFDAVFSNAALHWMIDAEKVISGVAKSLKKGGRFVVEMGGAGNIDKIQKAMDEAVLKYGYKKKNCWFFPTEAEEKNLLEKYGLKIEKMISFKRPTPFPTGPRGWLSTFGAQLLENIPEELHKEIIENAIKKLENELDYENGKYIGDYVRLRFIAYKE